MGSHYLATPCWFAICQRSSLGKNNLKLFIVFHLCLFKAGLLKFQLSCWMKHSFTHIWLAWLAKLLKKFLHTQSGSNLEYFSVRKLCYPPSSYRIGWTVHSIGALLIISAFCTYKEIFILANNIAILVKVVWKHYIRHDFRWTSPA